ncbi:MAG: hypothetical protein BWY62_01479 [Firmicutes bacterium ADurb.Bin356]|nr:MAG: hypothetical protein BWY62_01479 [Firmicutes bacterium ADurb.Bin356]
MALAVLSPIYFPDFADYKNWLLQLFGKNGFALGSSLGTALLNNAFLVVIGAFVMLEPLKRFVTNVTDKICRKSSACCAAVSVCKIALTACVFAVCVITLASQAA